MNTHTVIIECESQLPDTRRLELFLEEELEKGTMSYFGRNGQKVFSGSKALMKSLRGKFFIQFSFEHLLQLDSKHAKAVIKAALRMNMVKTVRRDGDGLEVFLP